MSCRRREHAAWGWDQPELREVVRPREAAKQPRAGGAWRVTIRASPVAGLSYEREGSVSPTVAVWPWLSAVRRGGRWANGAWDNDPAVLSSHRDRYGPKNRRGLL